jgi:hypothetical protein
MEFDFATSQTLGYYVYCLVDADGVPFYIGKGVDNRVFAHARATLSDDATGLKLDKIKQIISTTGKPPKAFLVRWQLSEQESFIVESALIDFSELLGLKLTNLVLGHGSYNSGIMSVEEAIATFSARKLNRLLDPCIIVNINRTKKRTSSEADIFEATRGDWVVAEKQRDKTRYALAEKRGLIVGVFTVEKWHPVEVLTRSGQKKTRWRFDGATAPKEIQDRYLHKSIAHIKMQGASNPIRYSLGKTMFSVGDLFSPEPEQFGLRGDDSLWRRLAIDFAETMLPPSAEELEALILDAVEGIIGERIEDVDMVKCAELETMGMSSGIVHGPTWREKLVPLLLTRYRTQTERA